MWPVKKGDGSWRLRVDYQGLNKVVSSIASAVPDMVSTIQKMFVRQTEGVWCSVSDGNAFFSISILEKSLWQFAFMSEKMQFTFTVLPQGYLNSLAYCHNLVRRSQVQQHTILMIIILLETEEPAKNYLNALVTHMTNQDWLVNIAKLQGPAQTIKF